MTVQVRPPAWYACLAIVCLGFLLNCAAGQELVCTIREDAWPLAFSPNDRYLASKLHDSQVIVWDAATGKKVAQVAVERPAWAAFQPNNTTLVIATHPYGDLTIWDFAADKQTPVVREASDAERVWTDAHDLSDDTRFVSLARTNVNQTTVWVQNLTDGQRVFEDKLGDWRVKQAEFSPDGKQLIVLGERREDRKKQFSLHVYCWDLAAGKMTNHWGPFPKSGKLVRRAPVQYGIDAMSPDGHWIATTTPGNGILVTEVATGRSRTLGPHPITSAAGPVPFGAMGGAAIIPGVLASDIRKLVFAPDGQSFATCAMKSDIVNVWPVAMNAAPTSLTQPDMAFPRQLVFSPSGKYLAVNGSMQPDNAPSITHIWRLAGASQ
jgi:WD40 repeat protein